MSQQVPFRGDGPLGLWWLGVAGLLVAGVLLWIENIRAFGYAVAVTLGVLAILRAVLPPGRAGGLVVRTRAIDVAILAAFAVAIAVLSTFLRLTA